MEYYYKGEHSINFDDKNSWEYFRLMPNERPHIAPAPVRTEYKDIPGANGKLDFTEALGGVKYQNRTGSWEFIVAPGYFSWTEIYNLLLNVLHGQKMKISLDDEPDYYYIGRVSVNQWKSNEKYSTVTLDYDLSPYKYPSYSMLGRNWLWDDLDWCGNGYTIFYGTFNVSDTKRGKSRTVVNNKSVDTTLSIFTTGDMEVSHGGDTYHIPAGSESRIIQLYPGNNYMVFKGIGTVTLSYEKGPVI